MIPLAVDTSLLTGAAALAAATAVVIVGLDGLLRRREHAMSMSVNTTLLYVDAAPSAGVDPAFLLESGEIESGSAPLETAIATGDVGQVVDSLSALQVYVLGHMTQEAARRAGARERQLLQVEAIDEGREDRLLLPIFTQRRVLHDALIEHPEWLEETVIELNGRDLLRVLAPKTWLLINPWSPRSFEVPPKDQVVEQVEEPDAEAST